MKTAKVGDGEEEKECSGGDRRRAVDGRVSHLAPTTAKTKSKNVPGRGEPPARVSPSAHIDLQLKRHETR